MKKYHSNSRAAESPVVPQDSFPSDQEMLRRLRALYFSPARPRRAGRAPSLTAFARLAGVDISQLYQITRGHAGIGPRTRPRIAKALATVEEQRKGTLAAAPQQQPETAPIFLDFGRFFPSRR